MLNAMVAPQLPSPQGGGAGSRPTLPHRAAAKSGCFAAAALPMVAAALSPPPGSYGPRSQSQQPRVPRCGASSHSRRQAPGASQSPAAPRHIPEASGGPLQGEEKQLRPTISGEDSWRSSTSYPCPHSASLSPPISTPNRREVEALCSCSVASRAAP